MFEYKKVAAELIEKGYKFLGWENSGLKVPEAPDWRSVYTDYTECIHAWASDSLKAFYAVDSGD